MTLDDARYVIEVGRAAGARVSFKQLGTARSLSESGHIQPSARASIAAKVATRTSGPRISMFRSNLW